MPARTDTIWGLKAHTALHVTGALTLLILIAFWLELGTGAFALGLILAVLPVPVYAILALWLDRYDPEPTRLLVKAFCWGAIVAVFFALIVNEWVAFITGSEFIASVAAAPFGEEVAKATALLLLFHFQRHHFDNVTDGVVYATMIGLGFATTENIYYYGSAVLDGRSETVFFLRGAVSPFAHPLFTAMTGIGIGLARETRSESVRAFAPVVGLATAISLHVAWNASVYWDAFFPIYLFTMMPAFVAVLLVVMRSLRREERMLREYLRPYVDGGTLNQSQLDEICASWWGAHAIRSRWAARRPAGPILMHDGSLRKAAVELAFHRWRFDREGALDPESHSAREQLLAQQLRECNAFLTGKHPRLSV